MRNNEVRTSGEIKRLMGFDVPEWIFEREDSIEMLSDLSRFINMWKFDVDLIDDFHFSICREKWDSVYEKQKADIEKLNKKDVFRTAWIARGKNDI